MRGKIEMNWTQSTSTQQKGARESSSAAKSIPDPKSSTSTELILTC